MEPRRLAAAGVVGALICLTCPEPSYAVPVLLARTDCLPASTGLVAEASWAQTRLAAERVWQLTRGEGQTVAVIDSGVDARVPQLTGGVLPGFSLATGWPANQDCLGGGTFTAGIIAARPVGEVAFVGVAPAARILPVRLAGDRWPDDPRVLAEAIRLAVDGGARVVCVAVPLFDASAALRDTIAYAIARDVLVVAMAPIQAQDRAEADEEVLRQVLTVGAVDPAGAPVTGAQPGTVDLVAPGSAVLSLGPGGPGQLQHTGGEAAVPFVAGTAALVRAYHPQLTAEQVKQRLQVTADRPGTRVPDSRLGWGTVNPLAAVTMVLPQERQDASPVPPPYPSAVPPVRPERPERAAQAAGLATLGTVAGMTILLGAVAATVRHSRSRRSENDTDPAG